MLFSSLFISSAIYLLLNFPSFLHYLLTFFFSSFLSFFFLSFFLYLFPLFFFLFPLLILLRWEPLFSHKSNEDGVKCLRGIVLSVCREEDTEVKYAAGSVDFSLFLFVFFFLIFFLSFCQYFLLFFSSAFFLLSFGFFLHYFPLIPHEFCLFFFLLYFLLLSVFLRRS
ncbi:PHKA_B [Acanthosepion pharaonis]|uniref:PHKA_B n=1 Tax=Acanthosepion pharaonis TaxID=158019 RepID=A0A812ART9_ACAPH|nr:PHKA_B [Sepia pharaonis]